MSGQDSIDIGVMPLRKRGVHLCQSLRGEHCRETGQQVQRPCGEEHLVELSR